MCRFKETRRVYKTTNETFPRVDPKDVRYLAEKLNASAKGNAGNDEKGVEAHERLILSELRKGACGVCNGMTCLWVHDYLFRVKPATQGRDGSEVDLDRLLAEAKDRLQAIRRNDIEMASPSKSELTSNDLQGVYELSNFSRNRRGGGGGMVEFAHDYQSAKKSFKRQDISLGFKQDSKVQAKTTVSELARLLGEGKPLAISWKIKVDPTRERSAAGYHCIGMVKHGSEYLLLDPNQGLFRFPDEETFIAELEVYRAHNVVSDSDCGVYECSEIPEDKRQDRTSDEFLGKRRDRVQAEAAKRAPKNDAPAESTQVDLSDPSVWT
ncbi:MAG TPA: hypothetical protein VJ890_20275 [Vineibacter sp.]|nr:hypothetical protein [Vineibacter sp.]